MKYALLFFCLQALAAEPSIDRSFEKANVKIGDSLISVGIADTESKREHGLMFVKSLADNEGMLFIFEEEQPRAFWMKNTLIPLAIGFFNSKGILIDIQEMKPAESLLIARPPTYQSAGPALFALEMNAGWFAKNHIKKGARIHLAGVVKSSLLKEKLGITGRSSWQPATSGK